MALNGIGGYGAGAAGLGAAAPNAAAPNAAAPSAGPKNAGALASANALDKFQQIRDLAKKKLEGTDNRTRLSDLLKQKQAELNRNVAVPQKMVTPAANFLEQIQAPKLSQGVSSAYGKAGGLEKTDSKPKLGRFVDFTA